MFDRILNTPLKQKVEFYFGEFNSKDKWINEGGRLTF